MEPECRPIPMQLTSVTCARIIKDLLALAQQRPYFCFLVQGELEDRQTWLREDLKQSRDLYKSARKELQAKSTTEKGELEDKQTRLRKELKQTMDLSNSACKGLQFMSATTKPIPTSFVDRISPFPTTTAVLSNFQGELEDILTRLRKEHHQTMSAESLYNFTCNSANEKGEHEDRLTRLKKVLQQAMPATEKVVLEDEVTRLSKELMQAMPANDLYYAAWKELQAMSTTEKRKYEATTSGGNGRIEGEGEYSVAVQYADAIGSVFKEPLKDVELLFSLSSQPPYFALSQRAEEREHNFARERAEEREEKEKEKKKWFKGLGSVVSLAIKFGKFAAPFIGIYLLNKNTGKKFDDFALQIKAANEARIGTTGCASPISCNLNISMFNANISASPRLGFLNREKRGNDVEVTGSK